MGGGAEGGGAAGRAHLHGLLFGVAGVVTLSPDALLLRLIDCDDSALIAMRSAFLALTTGALIAAFPALRRGFRWRPILLYALVFAAGTTSFTFAIKKTHVASVLVIIAITPLIAAVGARIFLRERTAAATWAAAALIAAGVALIFYDAWGAGGFLGTVLAFGAATALAANSIMVRRWPDVAAFPGLFWGGVISALAFAFFADWQTADAADVAWSAANGGGVAAVSFLLIIAAARRLPPAEVNLLFLLETVLGPLWVWLVLAEVPPAATFAAAALIVPVLALHAAWQLRGMRRGAAAAE